MAISAPNGRSAGLEVSISLPSLTESLVLVLVTRRTRACVGKTAIEPVLVVARQAGDDSYSTYVVETVTCGEEVRATQIAGFGAHPKPLQLRCQLCFRVQGMSSR